MTPDWLTRFLSTLITVSSFWVSFAADPALADDAANYAADGWIARCEPAVCRASLASDSRAEALLIGRFAATDGISIGLATPRGIADRDRSIDVRVDDRVVLTLHPVSDYGALERVDTFWMVNSHAADTLVQAMLTGKHLRFSYLDMVGAPHDADFALDGLAKLVDFIARQHPPGDPLKHGVAPPTTLARAPEASRIDLIIRMGIPERLLARHARASDCEDPNSPRLKSVAPVIGPLSRTAILYAIPCSASGADISYRLWVIETGEIGGMTPLYFALYDPTFGWKGSDLLYNVAFDATATRLTTASKASQPGGCGFRASWHWKGYAFTLDDFTLGQSCGSASATRIYPPK